MYISSTSLHLKVRLFAVILFVSFVVSSIHRMKCFVRTSFLGGQSLAGCSQLAHPTLQRLVQSSHYSMTGCFTIPRKTALWILVMQLEIMCMLEFNLYTFLISAFLFQIISSPVWPVKQVSFNEIVLEERERWCTYF